MGNQSNGKGKGGYQNNYNGKGGKGGFQSYTFQGDCWKCGEKGHRSFECPKRAQTQGIESEWIEPPSINPQSKN
eukprot:6303988-Karenia_brevis.AAC.1